MRIVLTEEQFRNIVKKAINESRRNIKSLRLYDIIQKHGAPHFNGCCDFHNITDDDILGVASYDVIRDRRHFNNDDFSDMIERSGVKLGRTDCIDYIKLNDGKYMVYVLRNGDFDKKVNPPEGGFRDLFKKTNEREKNRWHDRQYNYGLDEVPYGIRNPWFKDWKPESKKRQVDAVKKQLEKRREERRNKRK